MKLGRSVVMTFTGALSVFLFLATGATPAQTGSLPTRMQVVYLPFYSTCGDWDSKLTLNNSSAQPLSASVTLYSSDGSALPLPDSTLPPSQSVTYRLSELVAQAKDTGVFQEGSIEIRFNGIPNALGPQLTIIDAKHRLSFDEEPATDFKSSTLQVLWWSFPGESESTEEKSSAQFMLSNTTNQNLSVLVNVLWHGALIPAKPVSLSSHQMVVIEIEKLLKDLEIPVERIELGWASTDPQRPSGRPDGAWCDS